MSQEPLPSLNAHRGGPWSEWLDVIENIGDPLLPQLGEKNMCSSVSLLPRKDILLFGSYPKMDVRVICQCEKCSKVMMPSAFVTHSREKHGPDQVHSELIIPPGTSLLKKNKYSHSKNKKKTILPPPVPPPPLFPKQITPPTSPIAASQATADLPPPILQPVQTAKPVATPPTSPAHATTYDSSGYSSGSSSISSIRRKKSKKRYKKIKEYDPDKHCGVVEGHKGPCMRSITCSNHMVHLRKAVPGRSKDFHQLIADHKAAKEKELIKMNPPGLSLPKLDTTSTVTTSSSSTFSRSVTTSSSTFSRSVTTSFVITPVSQIFTTAASTTAPKSEIQKISQHVNIDSPILDNSSSQGNLDTPTSVMYMPMSPVAVVSPIQFVQLGGPILRVASTQPVLSPPLATQPIVVTIPVQSNNATMYTTHPKPLIMSTCSTRKVGGTFVLQNQRIDRQRSEIQIAANTRRSITNSCSLINTHHHKPNILKNSVRGSNLNKVSPVKRQATDKVVNDNKHIRLNDVNGFIIHADVNETSEVPQTNNSIHEKVTFINMK
ncbi:SCA7, zinc-binding domain [Popillia japonica]|uniref:SCA7, zinc-binding domain n=1 Tax=Popillia japonica TaxID=7064 RepID=A0AAW1NKA4_POPJA